MDGVVEPTPATWTLLQTETRRLRRLVDDLHELSRAEAKQLGLGLRSVAPTALVEAAIERLASDFAAIGLALKVDVAAGVPHVLVDLDRGVQVLTNLLTNALRYTPSPGEVVVSVYPADDWVRFQVKDSGIGLTVEELAHVFDRFYRVDKSRSRQLGGTGIGLTIARAIVEAMGGLIWAESPGPGRGATFGFDLIAQRAIDEPDSLA
jgi:signal transduction histidine kinase